jgi:hypothetical protein
MEKKKRKWGLLILLGFVGLCLSFVVITAIMNLFIPDNSKNPDQLSEEMITPLLEAEHLKQHVGDQVFPGFQSAEIPNLLFNEQHAFLLDMQNPATGWARVPQEQQRGGEWQLMPALDAYPQEPYYRTDYDNTDPDQGPDAFTVKVGETFVTSMPTAEWFRLDLMNQFRNDLPGFLKPVFPYQLIAYVFFPNTETYLSLILHESFHSYQAIWAQDRLEQAEWDGIRLGDQYPWYDQAGIDAWQKELDILQATLKAEDQETVRQLAKDFLEQRSDRRKLMKLSSALIRYENQREWVEGMARYVELETWRLASLDENYQPLGEIQKDSKFKDYRTFRDRWSRELDQIPRMASNEGDGRFYYTGMAQAYLLDQLDPEWKTKLAADPSLNLEDLLEEALNSN